MNNAEKTNTPLDKQGIQEWEEICDTFEEIRELKRQMSQIYYPVENIMHGHFDPSARLFIDSLQNPSHRREILKLMREARAALQNLLKIFDELEPFYIQSRPAESAKDKYFRDLNNRVPKDIQQVCTEVFEEAKQQSFQRMDEEQAAALDFLGMDGRTVKILTPAEITEWSVPLKPVNEEWMKSREDAGYSAQLKQVFDAINAAK